VPVVCRVVCVATYYLLTTSYYVPTCEIVKLRHAIAKFGGWFWIAKRGGWFWSILARDLVPELCQRPKAVCFLDVLQR
jgi:hypothetical protein